MSKTIFASASGTWARTVCRQGSHMSIAIGRVEHAWGVEIDDDTHVLMSFQKALLVDAEMWHGGRLSPLKAAPHRARHDGARMIPRQAEASFQGRRRSLVQPRNRQSLEQQREPRARLRPRHRDGGDAVRRARGPGNPCARQRAKLARVEIPPAALDVIIDRRRLCTRRTSERRPRRRAGPDVHFLRIGLQLHALDVSRHLRSQNRLLQRSVVHRRAS